MGTIIQLVTLVQSLAPTHDTRSSCTTFSCRHLYSTNRLSSTEGHRWSSDPFATIPLEIIRQPVPTCTVLIASYRWGHLSNNPSKLLPIYVTFILPLHIIYASTAARCNCVKVHRTRGRLRSPSFSWQCETSLRCRCGISSRIWLCYLGETEVEYSVRNQFVSHAYSVRLCSRRPYGQDASRIRSLCGRLLTSRWGSTRSAYETQRSSFHVYLLRCWETTYVLTTAHQ